MLTKSHKFCCEVIFGIIGLPKPATNLSKNLPSGLGFRRNRDAAKAFFSGTGSSSFHRAKGTSSPVKYQVCLEKALRAAALTIPSTEAYCLMFARSFKSSFGADAARGELNHLSLKIAVQKSTNQGCELDRFLSKFEFAKFLRVRVLRFNIFEFGKITSSSCSNLAQHLVFCCIEKNLKWSISNVNRQIYKLPVNDI